MACYFLLQRLPASQLLAGCTTIQKTNFTLTRRNVEHLKCRTAALQAASTTPTLIHPGVAATAPVALQPSGQAASQAYGEPQSGYPEPLGASLDCGSGAYNFALYSTAATSVVLCLFTEQDLAQGKATCEVELDPVCNRTGSVWHVRLPGLDSTLLYGAYLAVPVWYFQLYNIHTGST